MISPFGVVTNTRETYSRFYQKNFTEVEVRFRDEIPSWIPLETLLAIQSYVSETTKTK
tara:strand:- start:512 stop:685 length:174 start_codon:yes stop_codon:yes gene_type:complete